MQDNYYGGDYTLLQQDVTVTHQAGQSYTETISGYVHSSYSSANWDFSGTVTFPAMETPTQITTFTGTRLNGAFSATFTPNSNYTYKLTISAPGAQILPIVQEYNNYTSGQEVYLSASNINLIKKSGQENVTVRGTLTSYLNGSLVGSTYKTITIPTTTAGIRLKVNGVWKEATTYVRVNGVWKEAIPYIRINGQWKEGI